MRLVISVKAKMNKQTLAPELNRKMKRKEPQEHSTTSNDDIVIFMIKVEPTIVFGAFLQKSINA